MTPATPLDPQRRRHRAWRGAVSTLLVAAAAIGSHPARAALDPEALYQRVSPAVWTVRGDRGDNQVSVGSAVAVTPTALATACHVVDGAAAVTVMQGPTTIRIGSILRDPDVARDLCVLMTETPLQLHAVEIAPADGLRVGQRVFAIGSPHGLERTLSEGLISALRPRAPGQLPIVQTSAPLSSGSSGGGLFDDEGRLIGVTDRVSPGGSNLGFAYPAQWVTELPQRVMAERETWRGLLETVGVVLQSNGEPAPSGHADIADESALPVVGADPRQIRVAYRQFLLQARPRAFLITSDSRFGTVTSSAALTGHLQGCTLRKVVCAAYAVDDTVVWGKQQGAR